MRAALEDVSPREGRREPGLCCLVVVLERLVEIAYESTVGGHEAALPQLTEHERRRRDALLVRFLEPEQSLTALVFALQHHRVCAQKLSSDSPWEFRGGLSFETTTTTTTIDPGWFAVVLRASVTALGRQFVPVATHTWERGVSLLLVSSKKRMRSPKHGLRVVANRSDADVRRVSRAELRTIRRRKLDPLDEIGTMVFQERSRSFTTLVEAPRISRPDRP